MSAAPTGAGGSVGGGAKYCCCWLLAGEQEMQMVAGGNGLSSASKYGLGGWAEGWAGSRIVLQTIYRQLAIGFHNHREGPYYDLLLVESAY